MKNIMPDRILKNSINFECKYHNDGIILIIIWMTDLERFTFKLMIDLILKISTNYDCILKSCKPVFYWFVTLYNKNYVLLSYQKWSGHS